LDLDYVVLPAIITLAGIAILWLCIYRLRSLSRKPYGMFRRIAERTVLSLIAITAVLLAGSSAFNAIELKLAWTTHPPPGAIYIVNGARMHINCMGTGEPTIILDTGFGNNATVWQKIQPELAKTTRVCAYDRTGSGWSDPQPGPRDANQIVDQEHALLQQAGITGPIVLMGHSIAGLYVRAYATRFPEHVAGIVFVDGSSPGQFKIPVIADEIHKQSWLVPGAIMILGVPRARWTVTKSAPGLSPNTGRNEAEAEFHSHISALAIEMRSFFRSGDEVAQTGPYGTLPILIFSQDTAKPGSKDMAPFAAPWNQMQEDLKKLSTRSRRIIAKNSSHYIQLDRSDLIEKEVPQFIQQIRGSAPPPAYGTTTTE
jgi:pimeloyl-ACP methyl ester carboxylesterase